MKRDVIFSDHLDISDLIKKRRSFWLLVSTMFVSMLAFGIVAPLLPVYAKEIGATGFEVGAIFAGFSITLVLFLPVMGNLSDRFGRKMFLCAGFIGLAISSLMFIWARTPLQLIAIRCLQGFFATLHLPVAQAYVGDITPEGEEGRWMGNFNAVVFAGMGMGPFLGGIITDFSSIRATFLLMTFLLFLAFVATFFFLQEVKKRVSKHTSSFLKLLRRSGIMKAAFLFQLSSGVSIACYMVLLPIFITEYLKLSLSIVGLIVSTRSPISFLQSYTGKLADRYDRRLLTVLGMCIFGLLTLSIPYAGGFWSLLGLYCFANFGISLSVPAVSALVVEEGRKYTMGASMAIFLLPLNMGTGFGSLLFGKIFDLLGMKNSFFLAGILSLIFIIPFLFYAMAHHTKQREERLFPS